MVWGFFIDFHQKGTSFVGAERTLIIFFDSGYLNNKGFGFASNPVDIIHEWQLRPTF